MYTVVIDPGHVGGNFFDLRDFNLFGERFQEGNFCYVWASCLKRELGRNGIECILTRSEGTPSYIPSENEVNTKYEELILTDISSDLIKRFHIPVAFFPELSLEELLRAAIRNQFDLINRADIMNREDVDLCLSLHLNGDPRNLQTFDNGICGFTNLPSYSDFDCFGELISSLAHALNLETYKKLQHKQPVEGLYIRDDLTLCNLVKNPFLLLEGPFQNNRSSSFEIRKSLGEFYSTGTMIGVLKILVEAVGTFVLKKSEVDG